MDLHLDVAGLMAAADRAEGIRGHLVETPGLARDTAVATGHAGLGARLLAFAETWAASRRQAVRDLDLVAGALRAIADTFTWVDERLGADATRPGPIRAETGVLR